MIFFAKGPKRAIETICHHWGQFLSFGIQKNVLRPSQNSKIARDFVSERIAKLSRCTKMDEENCPVAQKSYQKSYFLFFRVFLFW